MFVCSELRKVRWMNTCNAFSADSFAKTFWSVCFSRWSSFILKKWNSPGVNLILTNIFNPVFKLLPACLKLQRFMKVHGKHWVSGSGFLEEVLFLMSPEIRWRKMMPELRFRVCLLLFRWRHAVERAETSSYQRPQDKSAGGHSTGNIHTHTQFSAVYKS